MLEVMLELCTIPRYNNIEVMLSIYRSYVTTMLKKLCSVTRHHVTEVMLSIML